MTVNLPFSTEADRQESAQFIAQLVREGVLFSASVSHTTLTITFTGGF